MTKALAFITAAALALAAAPASAQPGNILGVFGNWSAFTSGSGSSLTCYALSRPRATRPAAKRGSIYLMVSDWPGRRVKAEPQIVYGYQAKVGGAASLGVGPDKFTFFIRNDGKDGKAWLETLSDNPRLVAAMGQNVSAVAIGTSSKGTRTVDTYSLQGFNEAMAKVHAACQM